MSEPTTAAGRALLDCIPYVTVDWSMDEWRDEVRAIEAEAIAATVERLRIAVEGLTRYQVWEYRKAPTEVLDRESVLRLLDTAASVPEGEGT